MSRTVFDDEKWAAVIDCWKQSAPVLLKVWRTIDNVVVNTVKNAFADRLALWESCIYNRGHQWKINGQECTVG